MENHVSITRTYMKNVSNEKQNSDRGPKHRFKKSYPRTAPGSKGRDSLLNIRFVNILLTRKKCDQGIGHQLATQIVTCSAKKVCFQKKTSQFDRRVKNQ